MKRLDYEEKTNRKRAFILSLCIHVMLVAYIAYAGFNYVSNMGSGYTEIEFVGEVPKGKQATKFKKANSDSNADEQVKVRRANTKPKPKPKAKPKPVKKTAKASKDVKQSDVKVAKEKTPKKEPIKEEPTKAETLPTVLPDKDLAKEELQDQKDLEDDLAELAKEKSIQKGPNATDLGNDKLDVQDQTAQYGDPNAVRAFEELTPIQGNRNPVFPSDARRRRYAPLVVINFFVKQDGSVGDIQFIRAAQMNSINRSVVDAVRTWRFRPGKTGYYQKDFQFRLNQPTEVIPELLRRKK